MRKKKRRLLVDLNTPSTDFEAALYLCEFLYGKKIAQELAGGLVIDWSLDNVKHLIVN